MDFLKANLGEHADTVGVKGVFLVQLCVTRDSDDGLFLPEVGGLGIRWLNLMAWDKFVVMVYWAGLWDKAGPWLVTGTELTVLRERVVYRL